MTLPNMDSSWIISSLCST